MVLTSKDKQRFKIVIMKTDEFPTPEDGAL
jgi:hypothetical protein